MTKPGQYRDNICGIDWIQQTTVPQHANGEPLSIVDLFCGCGGLTLGVWESARFCNKKLVIKLAVDIDEDALSVYRDNFNVENTIALKSDIATLLPGDIQSDVTKQEKLLKEQIGKLDLLVAGPPCQGHSDLNNSTRRSDPRNGLYLKVVRAAELFQPTCILIENVPSVVHDKKKVFFKSLEYLECLGYTIFYKTLDASDYGLPQKRKRNILIAAKKLDVDHLQEYLQGAKKQQTLPVSAYLSGLEDEPNTSDALYSTPSRMTKENRERVKYLFFQDIYDLPNEFRPNCHRKSHSYVSMYGRLRWEAPAQTITSGFGSMGQGRFVHPTRPRMITPHEAARIQGFPDFFRFQSVKKRIALQKMIGNAVPPLISALVTDYLLHNLEGLR